MSERNATPTQPIDDDLPPFLPPVACKPWCEYQDGHPRTWAREDQWCGSKQLTIDLRHIQDDADPVNEYSDNYAVTYVMQRPGADPYVHLGFGENGG